MGSYAKRSSFSLELISFNIYKMHKTGIRYIRGLNGKAKERERERERNESRSILSQILANDCMVKLHFMICKMWKTAFTTKMYTIF